MTLLQTVAVAFSMFSAIPMPQFAWNQKNMRYALCAFPLIGVVIGAAMWAWGLCCGALGLPEVLRGAVGCAIPVLLTGGIHLDGYVDTQDARNSHQSFEKKQQILKDPHIGAFAAIRLGVYLVVSAGVWAAFRRIPLGLMLMVFPLSRSLSGLAVAWFPMARDTGLAHTFSAAADKTRVRGILAAVSAALMAGLLAQGLPGILSALAALAAFGYHRIMSQREFGGISGDLAGWFLQTAELWMLLAAVAGQYLEGIG